jgi:hypothetical protein
VGSWMLARYVAAIGIGLWSLQGFRMTFVYLGVAKASPLGIGTNLPFATRSLATAINCGVYSILLFCFGRPVLLAISVAGYWVLRITLQGFPRRFWFRYLAHVFVEMERRYDPSAVQETSGPRFEEAIGRTYSLIEDAHSLKLPSTTS